MIVTKRNGNTELVKFDKITERISRFILPSQKDMLDASKVAQETIKQLYSGISTEELDLESAKVCANMNTTHPLYNNLAGKLSSSNLHKNTLSSFVEKQNLIQTITKKCSSNNVGILDEKYLKYVNDNAEKLESIIDYNRDFNLQDTSSWSLSGELNSLQFESVSKDNLDQFITFCRKDRRFI